MADIEVQLLGGFEVRRDGEAVDIGAAKLRSLLSLYALSGRPVPREVVVQELWGDDPPASAVNTSQAYLSRLRKLVGHGLVGRDAAGHRLLDDVTVDVEQVRHVVTQARTLDADVDVRDRLAPHLDIAALVPLAGVDRGPVLASLRHRAEEVQSDVVELWAAAALATGEEAEVATRLAAVAEPRERAVELHMIALYRCGRHDEALARYRAYRRRLVDDLGIEPGRDIRAIHAAILRQDDRLVGAVRQPTGEAPLPALLGTLVGRRALLEQVRDLVGSAPLLTFVGPGGVGKSRLALELAWDIHQGQDDVRPVWLEVAPSTDLVRALNTALELSVDAGSDLNAVTAALRSRGPTVIVLDNAETQLRGVAAVADALIRSCPEVTVVVTSRELLAQHAEHVVIVPPLDLPGDSDGAEEGRDAPSVRLFTHAAERSGVAVTEADLPEVMELVGLLDGLPLAIELAGAWAGTLAIGDLLEQVRDRGLLPSPDDPAATSPVDGLLQSSWDALSDPERRLLAAMSLLVSESDLALVRALVDEDVVPLLASLRRRSLVQVSSSRGRTSVRILELTRQFGRRQLSDEVRDRALVGLGTELAARVDVMSRELRTGSGEDARQDFNGVRQQLLRTLDDLLAAGQVGAALDVVGRGWFAFLSLDSQSPAWDVVAILDREHRDALTPAQQLALDDALCASDWIRGEFDALLVRATRVLGVHQEADDQTGVTHAGTFRTYSLVFAGDAEEAMASFAVALRAATATEDHFFQVALHILGAYAAERMGLADVAAASARSAMTAAARNGDALLLSWGSWCRGRTHLAAGEVTEAAADMLSALRLIHGIRHRLGTALALTGVVSVLVAADVASEEATQVLAGALHVPESDPLILRHPLEDLDELTIELVDRLGPERFHALTAWGEATPLEDLVHTAVAAITRLLA